MTRRLTCHRKVNFDGEELLIYTLYEEGYKKEQIKKENPFCKSHEILVKNGNKFEFINKKAQ